MLALLVDVGEVVSQLLREFRGADNQDPLDGAAKPIGDFGLTSPDGLDFVCELSQRLGRKIPDNVNPFVDDSRRRARTVQEIIDWVRAEAATWPEDETRG